MRDEDVVRRLTAAIRRNVDPDVDAIVAHVRDAAIAEATTVLEAVMTRSILEQVADRLEATSTGFDVPSPAPPPQPAPGQESPLVWYVYGIQRADAALPGAVDGVVGATVDGVEAAGLRAIVSRVPAAELGEQALRERLEDFQWVAVNAQAHEAVLAAALQAGPVLPLRFGTVFHDRQAVVDVLVQHADALHAEADRMTGYSEWGAKVLVDVEACDRWIEEQVPGAVVTPAERTGSEARAYLARRQAERGAREVRRALLLDVASEVHERLSDLAVDASTDPPQVPELSEYEGEMILNGAYLLDDASIGPFHEAANDLADRHRAQGITIETTGPWPPHHFISLPPIDRDVGEPE